MTTNLYMVYNKLEKPKKLEGQSLKFDNVAEDDVFEQSALKIGDIDPLKTSRSINKFDVTGYKVTDPRSLEELLHFDNAVIKEIPKKLKPPQPSIERYDHMVRDQLKKTALRK